MTRGVGKGGTLALVMSGSGVIATVVDPEGRQVTLDAEGWQHIVANHPEMTGYWSSVLITLGNPEWHQGDPRPGRERYYRRGTGPSRWCLVVVDFTQTRGRVITAFGTRRDPEGWQQQ